MQTETKQKSLAKNKYGEYIRDFTSLGNPFFLLLISFCVLAPLEPNEKFWECFSVLVAGFFINEIVCSTIKFLWHKPRPDGQQFKGGFEKIDAGSFPSIHASRISFVYLTLSYIHYHEGNYYFLPLFISIIFLVGYSRIYLKRHFFTDVSAGYLFGTAAFGLAVLFLPG